MLAKSVLLLTDLITCTWLQYLPRPGLVMNLIRIFYLSNNVFMILSIRCNFFFQIAFYKNEQKNLKSIKMFLELVCDMKFLLFHLKAKLKRLFLYYSKPFFRSWNLIWKVDYHVMACLDVIAINEYDASKPKQCVK